MIAAPRPVALAVRDLAAHPADDREAACQRLLAAEVQRPFDLTRDLLLRATLVRLGEDEHVLLRGPAPHRLRRLVDGGVLARSSARSTRPRAQGRPAASRTSRSSTPTTPSGSGSGCRGPCWRPSSPTGETQLAEAPPAWSCPPTARARPCRRSGGRTGRASCPRRSAPRSRPSAARAGVTLFMTLLAAFQTLLARYTGQEDIVVGSPIAGRTRVETEGLIGFFVNTLVLRTDLTGNPTFRTLLARVREVCLDAYAHQDVPFEKLVEELKPERTLSQSPLFQVMFVLQNAPRTTLALPGLTLTPLRVESGTAKFDLTVFVTATDAGLQTLAEYNTDLFDAATIDRLLGHFQTLLEGDRGRAGAPDWRPPAPDGRGAAPAPGRVERDGDGLPPGRLHSHLVRGASRAPRCRGRRLRRPAAHLSRSQPAGQPTGPPPAGAGRRPDALVGLCLERSLEMVVGLLGILKAGAAYVPLDPNHPTDRLAYMLADAAAPVVVTEGRLCPRLPASAATVVCLDRDWPTVATHSLANPSPRACPENRAYVIYTSGSTGKPKGVSIPHRALCNHMFWICQEFGIHEGDRLLQKTPLASTYRSGNSSRR